MMSPKRTARSSVTWWAAGQRFSGSLGATIRPYTHRTIVLPSGRHSSHETCFTLQVGALTSPRISARGIRPRKFCTCTSGVSDPMKTFPYRLGP